MTDKIKLKASDGDELYAYVARPNGTPFAGLVVIQEAFGVNGHIRSVADGYARDGSLLRLRLRYSIALNVASNSDTRGAIGKKGSRSQGKSTSTTLSRTLRRRWRSCAIRVWRSRA